MREVPRRPDAEDMQFYRTTAACSLRTAIFAAIDKRDPMELEVYISAANAIGDYTVARSRWLKNHQEEYL